MAKKIYIFFLFLELIIVSLFILPSQTFAATSCGVAKIETDSGGQNYNVTYCVSSSDKTTIQNISQISVTCRRGPVSFSDNPNDLISNCSCHEDNWYNDLSSAAGSRLVCGGQAAVDAFINHTDIQLPPAVSQTQTVTPPENIGRDSSEDFIACYTVTSLSRDMGQIETQIKDSNGNIICTPERQNVVPKNYSWFEYYAKTIETRILPDPIVLSPFNYCADGKTRGVQTAIGCLRTTFDDGGLIADLIRISTGIGGGLSLMLIMYSSYILITSSGDPKKVQSAKDTITGAIIGLLFMILSIVIMNLLGVQILQLPGL